MNTTICKNAIKAALLANITNGGTPSPTPTTQQESDCDATAAAITNAIAALISSATIAYTTGLTSPSGLVTGTFGCTIS
jgi:hypothetical protein